MSGLNYFPNFVKAEDVLFGNKSYNIEVADGQNPPGEFFPAPYLPVSYSEDKIGGSWYTMAPGKVISLDSNKRIIPAGLGWAEKKETAFAGDGDVLYSVNDQNYGIVDAQENLALADGNVAASMVAAGIEAIDPVGIIRYAALTAPGSDPSNPSTFYRHSYDTGGTRAFSRWCYVQVPVLEVGQRTETIPVGTTSHRITLWPNGAVVVGGLVKVANPTKFTAPAVANTADQFCLIGRTLIFNAKIVGVVTAVYTPIVDTPFMTLETGVNPTGLLGQDVTFNKSSNFMLADGVVDALGYQKVVGKILDVKLGQNDDFKLVRTLFRDAGLRNEQPGSATDGRNTQLSIANAPKYIARIAVNFQSSFVSVPVA